MNQALIPYQELTQMADAIAASKLFGFKTKEEVVTIMLIAQAENRHPVLALRDYDLINGKPAKKSEAMLRDFIDYGGKVEWHELSDSRAEATFSHPAGGTVRIDWDMERAKKAGISGKDMYGKYTRAMFRSRVVSEGVRSVCPAATSGMYVPEEVREFQPKVIVHKDVQLKEIPERIMIEKTGEDFHDEEEINFNVKKIEVKEAMKKLCLELSTKNGKSPDAIFADLMGDGRVKYGHLDKMTKWSQIEKVQKAIEKGQEQLQ